MVLELKLPYPPSINHYWRHISHRGRPRVLISREGRAYRKTVMDEIMLLRLKAPMGGRLKVKMDVYPPDNRRRDIDNPMKACLDAMQHAGVYFDDNQIDELLIRRCEKAKGGLVDILLIEGEK